MKKVDDFITENCADRIKDLERKLAEATRGRQKPVIQKHETNTVKFGLIGDTHFGSMYCQPYNLEAYYDYAHKQGVSTIYHAGDVLSGHKVFRGHDFEVSDYGFDAQVERLSKSAPRLNGMSTKFITGNHDASFHHAIGVSVGMKIQQARPDWIFLGDMQADVIMQCPAGKYRLRLLHPDGGTAFAMSYKPQHIIGALSGGDKPNMIGIGHYHKAEMMPAYRNVCSLQVGTFESQTPFMARKSSPAHVGGWIVEVALNKTSNCIKTEFVAFYY